MAEPEHQVIIEARGLVREFDEGRVQALRGADFTIRQGEFVAVVGPSGCGKSTLLQLLGALDVPTRGEVLFKGQSLNTLADPAAFRARSLGFVFQSFHLLPTLSALENVQVPMFEIASSSRERRRKAAELLEAFGLGDRMDHLPVKLSGGERQRVAIARSLANGPELLLADEPTGNLDSESSARVLELLQHIHEERHMTLIVVTHDPDVASQAHRTVRMRDGRIITDTLRGEGRT